MALSSSIGVWIGAFLTLCILSFLYKDNPFYKFAEHLFIGISAAYWMVMGFWTTMVPNLIARLYPPVVRPVLPSMADARPNPWFLVPLVFGILLLMRLSPKGGWLSRWALAFIVGTTAGLNFIRYLQSDFIGQIHGSLIPVTNLSNIIIVLGTLCGLIYFFFSKEHKGIFGSASRVGVWVLMVAFGASFGYTVMGRIALLVGRMEFLFRDWLGVIR